jgi:uncharacterized protein
MDMTGEQRIAAPRATVLAALNHADVLRTCVRGYMALEKTSDTEMKAAATLDVGPVKANFAGNVTLSEIDAPTSDVISGQGSVGVAGFAKGSAKVEFAGDGPDHTLQTYTVKAGVGGKFAPLGGRLIDQTAKKRAGEVFKSFGELVGPEEHGDDAEKTKKKKGFFKRLLGK